MSRPSRRQKAARRLSELLRLAAWRRKHGVQLNAPTWAFVLAATLASAPEGLSPVGMSGRSMRWRGLDLLSLRQAVHDAAIGHFDDDELGEIVRRITPGCPPISSRKLGEMLGLTTLERDGLDIRSIDAADEDRATRRNRQRQERRESDAERKRLARAAASKGRGLPLSVSKPWVAEGVSEAAYRKRMQREKMSKKPSAFSQQTMSKKPSAFFSERMSKNPSTHLLPIRESGRAFGHVGEAAPADHLWPSKPAICSSLGGGFAGAVGNPLGASAESNARGTQGELGDGRSSPKSEALKRKTSPLGRASQKEDPRAKIIRLCRYAPDEIDLAAKMVGRGDAERGFVLLARLDEEFIRGLDERLGEAGAAGSELAIRAARSASLRLESLAVRRAAP